MKTSVIIALVLYPVVTGALFYMWRRNKWVYKVRMETIEADYFSSLEVINAGQWTNSRPYLPTYNRLASYHWMLLKFWVWDVRKFLKPCVP
jgi:hypothetical protein